MKNEFQLQFVLSGLIVLLLIFVSSKINITFDFSENKIYSISDFTKNIFNTLEGNANITWIRSKNANKYFPNLNYLEDILNLYSRLPNCVFEIIDSNTLTADALNGLGIYPEQVSNISRDEKKINSIYSAILVEYNGMTKVLPFVFNLQEIEYTIANNLIALSQDSVGLSINRNIYILTFPNATINDYVYVLPFLEYDNFIPIIVNDENIKELNSNFPLVVIGSSFFTDEQIQMVTKFLETGGRAAFFVSGTTINVNGNWKCTPKQNDKLLDLLSDYGFIISQDVIFDIFNYTLTMNSRDGLSSQNINYPFWIRVNAEQADLSFSFFSNYNTLQMYWPSSLDLNLNVNTNLKPVITTSSKAKSLIENIITDPFLFSIKDYENIRRSQKVLAGVNSENKTGQKIFVMADEYFLSRCIEFTNSDSNLKFFVSICQWLKGNENLLKLKNKAESIKPFKTFEDKNKIESTKNFARIFNLIFIPVVIFLIYIFKNSLQQKKFKDD